MSVPNPVWRTSSLLVHRVGKAVWIATAIALLLFCVSDSRAQGWNQYPNSPTGTTRHDDVHFADENFGWSTKGVSIYGTSNGGTNWNLKITKSGTHFRCIGFASATRGWAGNLGAGSYDGNVTDTNVLYETFDGGDTWSVVPGINETGMKGLCAMHVLDSQHIFGGGRVRGPAYFIKSSDGGTNWTVSNLTAPGVMGAIMDVYFHDPLNGFVVGMSTNQFSTGCATPYTGRIARTTDGGATWSPVVPAAGTCSYFWKMSWPSRKVGYTSLQQNGSDATIVYYKTVDGGLTWSSNSISTAALGASAFFLQSVGFVDEENGWLGGHTQTTTQNFLQTTNGGLTWNFIGYNNTRSINRIRFLHPGLGFASGQQLHVYRSPLGLGRQPEDQSVRSGTNVVLDIQAGGIQPIFYQWYKNGDPIAGATASLLTLTNVTRSDGGAYFATVTNAVRSLHSRTAIVEVISPQRMELPAVQPEGIVLRFSDADGSAANHQVAGALSVQTSSNLVEWLPLTGSVTITNNSYRVLDSNQANGVRFYRTIE